MKPEKVGNIGTIEIRAAGMEEVVRVSFSCIIFGDGTAVLPDGVGWARLCGNDAVIEYWEDGKCVFRCTPHTAVAGASMRRHENPVVSSGDPAINYGGGRGDEYYVGRGGVIKRRQWWRFW